MKAVHQGQGQETKKKIYPKISLVDFMAEVGSWKFDGKNEPKKRRSAASKNKLPRR